MRTTDMPIIRAKLERIMSSVESATFVDICISPVTINNYFENLQTLILTNHKIPDTHLEKIQSLPYLTVKHLSVDYKNYSIKRSRENVLKNLRMSTWLKLFPNLEVLELRKIVQDDTLLNEIKYLKVLKIRDKLENNKILSKFPNLCIFVQEWPKDNFNQEVRRVKSYLPFCKLYNIDEGIEEIIHV